MSSDMMRMMLGRSSAERTETERRKKTKERSIFLIRGGRVFFSENARREKGGVLLVENSVSGVEIGGVADPKKIGDEEVAGSGRDFFEFPDGEEDENPESDDDK